MFNKTKAGLSYRPSGTTKLLTVLTFLAVGALGHAQLLFQDDFEGYADDPALKSVWINDSAAASGTLPTGTGVAWDNTLNFIPSGGTKSGKTLYAYDGSYVTLPNGGASSTIASKITVYLYRNSVSTTVGQTRFTAGTGASTSSQNIGIGWFNNASAVINGVADTFKGTNFQGRHLGAGGNFYFNLDKLGTPHRTVGWHKFDIERVSDENGFIEFRFYVDDILGRSVTNSGADWNYLLAGFRTTSGTPGLGGEAVHIDGVSIVTNHPFVTSQPTNQALGVGGTAVFTVVATNDPTGYQWRFNGKGGTFVTNTDYLNIPGANSATLTINNVQTTNVGFYSVIVSNANGSVGSAAARLTITVPTILSGPTSVEALQGGNAVFTVTSSGATPLTYYWKSNSVTLAGNNTNVLRITNIQASAAGTYSVIVSNSFGQAPSTNAVLTVIPKPVPPLMSVLWKITPGSVSWFPATGSTARGLAYNPVSGHVLVASRTGGSFIHVLDKITGAELYTMSQGLGIITGGTFDQSSIGVADDGAVYVANLTTDSASNPLKVYRYADDASTTEPEVVYQGDPGLNGFEKRWGDTFDIRGAGANTQILLGSRNGVQFTLLTNVTTANAGVAVPITVSGASNADFGLGLAFGAGDTFWAKEITKPLRRIDFNGNILNTYSNLSVLSVIGVNPSLNRLAANGFENIDSLRLYDISNLGAGPSLQDFTFYLSPTGNANFGVGAIDFSGSTVYALDDNNGIIAWVAAPPTISINRSGASVTLSWSGSYNLQSATNVAGPYSTIGGATTGFTESASGSAKFYRLSQ